MKHFLLIVFIPYLFGNTILFAQSGLGQNKPKYFNDPGKQGSININSDSEIQRLANLKANLAPSLRKLSTDLLQLLNPEFLPRSTTIQQHSETMKSLKQFKPDEKAVNFEESVMEGIVYVYVYLFDGYSTHTIDGIVEEVISRDENNNMAIAWVKVKKLKTLATLQAVRTIRTVMPPIIRTGSVTTEGDLIHRTSNVRSTYGMNGTGIKIGIISDGVDSRATSQASGDLPPDGSGLTVLSNTFGGDEGTAILEIVHDMVPGAELYFHDLGNGSNTATFNSAVDDLVTAGCNIICDDIGWLLEPFYEDGTVASHINSVISSNDIIYVSSAGNSGNSHYQGNFYPIVGDPTVHDFSEGDTTGNFLYLPLSFYQSVFIVLQWDDPFGGSGNDYDLYLINLSTSDVVALSQIWQTGTEDPLEYISYTRIDLIGSTDYAIAVNKYLGDPKNLEVFIYAPFNYSNNIKPEDAIYGHPAVDGVVSVGAVRQSTPTTIEYFSSQGPSTIAFPSSEVRQTPKIVGVDGVKITGAGGFPNPFYGTSASAPHIAAILAQAWSYDLMQTGNEVRQLLYNWPEDLGSSGFDNVFGYGRGDALNIFSGALPVELSSFTLKVLNSGGVKLDWRTETEINNYGFEIERSQIVESQNTDFEKIGFVEGYGNSNSPKEYKYLDKGVSYGNYAYRLKQIDNDGTFEYSDIIEVNAGDIPDGFVLEQNYPNPFNPSTKIKFAINEANPTTLKVYDILGNEIAQLFNETTEAGNIYEIEFDASHLSSGLYYYRLSTAHKSLVRKMLLLR